MGKFIVITGNRRGLGAALTSELELLGHRVEGCSSSPLSKAQVDVANLDAVNHWAQVLLERNGAPDLLINNAGWFSPFKPLWEQDTEDFQHILDINLRGVFYTLKAFLPAMIARGSGVVINISSGWGRTASPNVAPYCATKWALEGLTRALAQELPSGLAAVTLDPGTINTDMVKGAIGAAAEHFPKAAEWAKVAAPFVLNISLTQNGSALSIPRLVRES